MWDLFQKEFPKLCFDEYMNITKHSLADQGHQLSADEKRVVDVAQLLFTISHFLEVLHQCKRYVEVSSRRPTDISKEDHIRFHAEVFIQTIYNLQEKLHRIVPTICKRNGVWVERDLNKKVGSILREYTFGQFKNLTELRRALVHDSAPYFDRMHHIVSTSSLMVRLGKAEFSDDYRLDLWMFKRDKLGWLSRNIEATEHIVGQVFEMLAEMYVKDGQLNFPNAQH